MGSRKQVLTQLIQDAVLKLCTQNVDFDASLEIDGIICVTSSSVASEIVVKMHRTIMKSETQDPEPQWREQQYPSSPNVKTPLSKQTKSRVVSSMQSHRQIETYGGEVLQKEPVQTMLDDPGENSAQGFTEYYTQPPDSSYNAQVQATSARKRKTSEIKHEPGVKQIKIEDPDVYIEEPADSASAEPSSGNADAESDFEQINTMGNPGKPRRHFAGVPEPVEVGNRFSCTDCPMVLPTIRCVDYHQSTIHNKYCELCNARYATYDDMAMLNHCQAHMATQPNCCKDCYKSFKTASGLIKHTSRDLQCLLCGKTFNRATRAQHLKLHQKST